MPIPQTLKLLTILFMFVKCLVIKYPLKCFC